ncbi:MAG: citrate lyase acyl carrier protein [Candidatus Polarisedimenticolia bacterium]|nr:citrate lyase acyl carrier protein [bacterium]
MEPKRRAQAGSFESSDILVLVEPVAAGAGRTIELDSIVMPQYGDEIIAAINRVLDRFEMKDAKIVARDKGALDCTIDARVETALRRALGIEEGTAYEAE